MSNSPRDTEISKTKLVNINANEFCLEIIFSCDARWQEKNKQKKRNLEGAKTVFLCLFIYLKKRS